MVEEQEICHRLQSGPSSPESWLQEVVVIRVEVNPEVVFQVAEVADPEEVHSSLEE